MANTNSFSLSVDAWIKKAKGKTSQVVRKIAFDMSSRIIGRTPVKTGRARANWMLGIGTPNTQTVDATDKDGNATSTMILSELTNYNFETGKPIFITNSVPYIVPLENGHSKKAPDGMVKITVAEFQSIVQGEGQP